MGKFLPREVGTLNITEEYNSIIRDGERYLARNQVPHHIRRHMKQAMKRVAERLSKLRSSREAG
jgi:chaperonin GroEL (HSP60 family)